MIMTPWTWSIAYRRFNQGVLIRYNHSRAVGVGTVIRLTADLTVLLIGFSIGTIPGIVVATSAVSAGIAVIALAIVAARTAADVAAWRDRRPIPFAGHTQGCRP
jgi:hypothetical protein